MTNLMMMATVVAAIGVLSGCGSSPHAAQRQLPNGLTVISALNPYPIGVMMNENVELDFMMNNQPVAVSDVYARMDMTGMKMGDELQLAQQKPGVYQSSYKFSMSGRWMETVKFLYLRKNYKVQFPLQANN